MTGKPSKQETEENGSPKEFPDWECYAALLESPNASDSDKQELLETLWSIVSILVDWSLRIHPLQQVCEQNSENGINLPDDLVSSLNSPKTESCVEEIEIAPSLQTPELIDSRNKNEEAS